MQRAYLHFVKFIQAGVESNGPTCRADNFFLKTGSIQYCPADDITGAEGTFGASNSSVTHLLQFTSQQQGDMHEQQKDEIQQQGEQQEQRKVTQGLQQQQNPEEHSNQQEQFEQGRMQHPEQSQLRLHDRHEHQHLEPHKLQQEQHWQPEQQLQMQQMLQQPQPLNLQEMHTQHLQNPEQQQHELPLQLQQQQQELPSQLQPQQQELHLQSQRQELPSQSQRQEVLSQLPQQQLPPQLQQEHLNQLLQTQQQQVEQSPLQPQQQHLQQLPQPQQQYLLHSQQQPQQSSAQLQQQHLQHLPQAQQQPQHQLPQAQQQPQHQLQKLPLQQHLPQSQQQLQQSSLKSQQQQSQHFSQPQQQTQQQLQQLPLQSQEQHLLQSQQQPQEQLQQSLLPSQHQHLQQLPQPQHQPQQSPLPSQQQHLQRLSQPQQQPQQKLQQLPLQQQQQHLQQSQQQPQQQLPQPQKQHLQQLLAPQQQHSQQLPQSQLQIQQQPHLQQLSQSQQQIQQQQLQPQVQQQQQQQFNHQLPLQPAVGQATISSRGQNTSGSHSISFGSLIPMILPHLSREQSERLQGLYSRLRRNEVTKEDFLRATRNVVGDQMLVQAVRQMQQKQQAQSQLAPSSQANQQQQQQRLQQHTQGTSQQFAAQQSIHTQQLNEPQPFQQVSPVNLQQQAQRTSDYQPHSETSTTASLTVAHSSSDNKPQLRQAGEQCSEIPSVHGNQASTINLHQVKHEVDRTMIGMPASNQQQQQHMQVPQSPFSMYGRTPGNYSSHSFSVSPGISPIGVKAPPQDSQTRQVIHPQVGVQVQGGPPQLSNVKTTPKHDLSKLSKRREDEERQKMLQSGGASHSSGQHQPSVWATSLDKEKAGNTGISPLSSVHIKQEINDNSDQQHNIQTLQPMTDNISTIKGVALEHGQSSVLPKTEGVEHQSIKTGGISSANTSIVNQPFGSSGVYSDHLMQAPLATSSSTLHHTLSGFGGPISGGHPSGNPLQGQARIQVPLTSPSSVVGSQIKTPPKKTLIGQKKPYEVTGPTQLASKKQKVSGGYLDQSIDQLNDVTAVSGVNLREEEEQLFAGPKEESRATEAMRRVVQEEEDRTFLQKGPLRAKLAGIMAKYGLKFISSDSERCLSLCVEERLRTMIGHLIRLSKQRGDLERVSHKVAITSDVRRQIHAMNKKAKDDLEKKQAEEAEKLRKLNETENNAGPEGEKDETRTKAQKAQKEEDDKMRANAANVAARAAVGGDDMLSKWQLMAEQARQKREGASDGASNSRTNRDVNRKTVVNGLKSTNVSDHQDAPSTGIVRNLGRTLGPLSQTKSMHTICVKDVIALLEREPQMTKSTLLYRLYERGSECNKERGSENQNNENTLQ